MVALFGALVLACMSQAAFACTVTGTTTSNIGPYSPGAIRAGAVPAISNFAGLNCPTAVLVLLSDNNIKAKFTSQNGLKLISGANTINYVASADPNGTITFSQGSTVDYMQNNLLNLLGLLGGSSANLPIFVKPSSAVTVPVGTYSDVITIDWSWKMCTGIGALGACIGTLDQGTGQSKITVNLTVAANNLTMTVSTTTTWDPINTTTNPKALPLSKRRSSYALYNPDIVAVDQNVLAVVIPTPGGLSVALDGDGASGGSAITLTEGSPASGVTLTYTSPSSTSDGVDFSSDGGTTWTYYPTAGNAVSQAAVTHVRIRPTGSMAAGSRFSVSIPYSVR